MIRAASPNECEAHDPPAIELSFILPRYNRRKFPHGAYRAQIQIPARDLAVPVRRRRAVRDGLPGAGALPQRRREGLPGHQR